MVSPTLMTFASLSTLALRAKRPNLIFLTAFAVNFVFSLLSFFISALFPSLVKYSYMFEGTTALSELGFYLLLPAGGNVFDISARVITSGKRTVSDVQARKLVAEVPVVFTPGFQETLAEGTGAAGSLLDSFEGFPDPASSVPIVEDEAIEEDFLWD